MNRLISFICRVLFIVSFIMAGIAVWEKMANMMGYTITRGLYANWQLLEFAAITLLFVIALQLREIKAALGSK